MTTEKKDVSKIEEFLKQLKIDPEKARHGDNMWSLKQGEARIFIITAGGFLIFQSPIMAPPKQNLQTFYRTILELNDNATETLGASFGINSNNEVILKSLYPMENINSKTFSYFLTSMAHVAEKYLAELRHKFNM